VLLIAVVHGRFFVVCVRGNVKRIWVGAEGAWNKWCIDIDLRRGRKLN
jgi:hypothetical protein